MSANNEMANRVSGTIDSPLRRSARLSRGRMATDTQAPSPHRRAQKSTGGTDAMDASAWSSSLYSARDPSQVSSYYLRPFDGESKDASMDESLTGLGSLLRGSQRPTGTPRSYVHDARRSRLSLNDYSEEDRFMERVESEWRQRADAHNDADGGDDPPSTTPELERADDPVFDAQPTPHVPGLFKSVLSSAKRAKPSFFEDEKQEEQEEQEKQSGPSRHNTGLYPGIVAFCVLAGILAAVYAGYLNLRQNYAFSPFSTSPSEPLVTSRPLPSTAGGQELRDRILSLEGAVNKVWRSVGDLGATQDKMAHRVAFLEQNSVQRSSFESIEQDIRTLKKHHAESMKRWQSERARLEAMLTRKGAGDDTTGDAAAQRARLAELEKRVTRAEKDVAEALSTAAHAKRAWEPLRDFLPDKMPVRYDARTKQVSIDPAFWHEFRKVVPARHDGGAAMPTWHAFLAEHESELGAMFARIAAEHAPSTSSSSSSSPSGQAQWLDKATFTALMEAEMTRAKTELTTRFNEHVHELESDVLAKVQYRQRGQQEAASEEGVSVDDVRAMIDAALAVYAADQIARADYAQYSAGARVIPSLTSPTHEVRVQGANVHSFTSMLAHFVPVPLTWSARREKDSYTVRGRMPVVALHHDTSPGMCWPFSGSHGQLGIQLVRRILIDAITIDHVASGLALDGLSSAPRDMEVWGIADTPRDRERVEQWRAAQPWVDEPAPMPPSPAHVFLGSFTYDAHAGAPPVQTFPIGEAVRELGVAFRTVQLSVLSNHGLRDFTCLYRVRVHGEPPAP